MAPHPPKRKKLGIGYQRPKKKRREATTTAAASSVLKEPPQSSISSPPATRKRAPTPFVSPPHPKRRTTKTSSAGGLLVQELLEIFTQLEGPEGLDLKAAMVHGRKNLQAMADQGRTTTDVSTAVEMTDDSTTATAAGASTINSAKQEAHQLSSKFQLQQHPE